MSVDSCDQNVGRKSGLIQYPSIEKDDPAYKKYIHCCHCLIYCKSDKIVHGVNQRGVVLMELRFDGYLGFPGGLITRKETRTFGLNRELGEELNWRGKSFKDGPIKEKHYQSTHVDELKKLVLHFYAIEVNEKEINNIEKNYMSSVDLGNETFGLVRVPLYTLKDGYRGFPAFLDHNFIGNAKYLLLKFLEKQNIITQSDANNFINRL